VSGRREALKDDFDEWLARVICFAFSLPPTAFTKQVNRNTAENRAGSRPGRGFGTPDGLDEEAARRHHPAPLASRAGAIFGAASSTFGSDRAVAAHGITAKISCAIRTAVSPVGTFR
jgi:hypothetical protein